MLSSPPAPSTPPRAPRAPVDVWGGGFSPHAGVTAAAPVGVRGGGGCHPLDHHEHVHYHTPPALGRQPGINWEKTPKGEAVIALRQWLHNPVVIVLRSSARFEPTTARV
eukprot:440279-Prorocentrum_minimum.AAC.2